MNIGSIDLTLTNPAVPPRGIAVYESPNRGVRLEIAHRAIQHHGKLPKQIEIKIWVDADAFEEKHS